jgi:hypothetical protein
MKTSQLGLSERTAPDFRCIPKSVFYDVSSTPLTVSLGKKMEEAGIAHIQEVDLFIEETLRIAYTVFDGTNGWIFSRIGFLLAQKDLKGKLSARSTESGWQSMKLLFLLELRRSEHYIGEEFEPEWDNETLGFFSNFVHAIKPPAR